MTKPTTKYTAMKFILGRKLNMTQIFDKDGVVHPATIISVTPIVVTQVKNKETDGYASVQVGEGVRKASRLSKAVKGHTKELGNFAKIQEFTTVEGDSSMKVGDKIYAGQPLVAIDSSILQAQLKQAKAQLNILNLVEILLNY